MAKAKEKEKIFEKRFLEVFQKLTYCRSSWDVWDDFLSLSTISIANCVPGCYRQDREEEYLKVISRYKKEEQELLVELFSIVVDALTENPRQDFIGGLYNALRLQQKQKGQFFTPYHICEFMSEVQFAGENVQKEIKEKGYISVNDPACGAGALLVAFANVSLAHGINYQRDVLFVAQDIDYTAVRMCYLQLSLLGCPAIVIHGDSLLKPDFHPDNDIWYSPMYFLNAWKFRQWIQETGEEQEPENAETAEDKDEDGQKDVGQKQAS